MNIATLQPGGPQTAPQPFTTTEKQASEIAPGRCPSSALIDHAHRLLIEGLERYGNRLTDAHKDALRIIVSTFTDKVYGHSTGWSAIPLGTGMGKTQSIIAWITALHRLGIDGVSVVVCASQVEALCDIKRALMDRGVPEEIIGLWHSYPYDPEKAREYMAKERQDLKGHASLPSTTDHQSKRILLVTHNRARGGGINLGSATWNMYQGGPRDLVIWDESFFISDSWAIEKWKLKSAALGLSEVPGQKKNPLLTYLNSALDLLCAEEAAQESGRAPQLVQLPSLTVEDLDVLRGLVQNGLWGDEVKTFLDICHNPLRLYKGQQSSMISYEVMIPQDIQNLVVLDASHSVRKLCHANRALKSTGGHLYKHLVSYENVTIHQLTKPSGRTSVKEYTKELATADTGVLKEAVEVIMNIPDDEAIIVFTFKQRSSRERDSVKTLKRSLQKNGIDPDQMIDAGNLTQTVKHSPGCSQGTKRRRINFLTWGNECSLNHYSYCSHVILAGVLHRNPCELVSKIAGETGDLMIDVPGDTLREIQTSEVVHCIYQALSRGSSRIIENGKAKTMNAWVIHSSHDIQPLIDKVMPKVKWQEWRPKQVLSTGRKKPKQSAMTTKILRYLDQLPPDINTVSSTAVKKAMKIPTDQSRTFKRALGIARDRAGCILSGRSLVRGSSLFSAIEPSPVTR